MTNTATNYRLGLERTIYFVSIVLCVWGVFRSYEFSMKHFETFSVGRAENAAKAAASVLEPSAIGLMKESVQKGDGSWSRMRELALWKRMSGNGLYSQRLPVHALFGLDKDGQRTRAIGIGGGRSYGGFELPWTREALQTFQTGAVTSTAPYQDQRDRWITAYAPLRDTRGSVVGAVQVDYRFGDELDGLKATLLTAWLVPLGIGVLLLVSSVIVLRFRIPVDKPKLSSPPLETKSAPPALPPWRPSVDYFYSQFLNGLLQRSQAMRKSIFAKSFSGGGIVVDGSSVRPVFQSLTSVLNCLIDKDIEGETERQASGKPSSASIAFDAESIRDPETGSPWLWLGISTDGRGTPLDDNTLKEVKRAVIERGGTLDTGCRRGQGTWITVLLPLLA